MLFGSSEIAARIEGAECRLLRDGAAAVLRRDPDAGVEIVPISGGVAVFTVDGSPLNKVAGLGFAGPLDEARLEAAEQVFIGRGAPIQAEVSCLADPSVGEVLTRRGYTLRGFENVLGRPLSAGTSGAADTADLPADLVVSPCDEADRATMIDVLVSGFLVPDDQGVPSHESFTREVLERVMRDLVEADRFAPYLGRRRGQIAGAACMRVFDGVAQLCGAATLPPHRRNGLHTAMLDRRLADASRAGCDVAVITTLPGSKSQQNAQRRGFHLLYTRALLVRDA